MKRLTILLVLLAACGQAGPLDACDEFAEGYETAATPSQRVELAETVSAAASGELVEPAEGLVRGADNADSTWQLAADVFAATCFDEGWDG